MQLFFGKKMIESFSSGGIHVSRQVMAGCECVACMFCFSPLCFGKGCVVNELGKLSETEWENILLPSVYSSTHTLNWPIVHFHHLGENVQGILPFYFDL